MKERTGQRGGHDTKLLVSQGDPLPLACHKTQSKPSCLFRALAPRSRHPVAPLHDSMFRFFYFISAPHNLSKDFCPFHRSPPAPPFPSPRCMEHPPQVSKTSGMYVHCRPPLSPPVPSRLFHPSKPFAEKINTIRTPRLTRQKKKQKSFSRGQNRCYGDSRARTHPSPNLPSVQPAHKRQRHQPPVRGELLSCAACAGGGGAKTLKV